MARVIITLKIMPDGIDMNMDDLLERVKGAIPEGTDVRANEVIPVAFGLKALRMNVAREEAMGGTDDIEAAISALDGVAQVEVEMVSRM
ncbi:MAG: elongation factor 1-beta [Candidatus Thorarchaeota archaeon]|jgi:elongation factor 1-beta|nr:elongation factor 1-beta [Candidatus Thorarchaeota archaeon]MCK4740393.1 elongation factor 1-beta [Candidatus Thorarchaeota archaeon]